MNARLEEIRKKRDALVTAAGASELFGKTTWDEWKVQHRTFGTMNEAALSAIEERNAVTLPDDYRAFVLEVADGGLGPGTGLFDLSAAIADAPEFTGRLADPFPYGDAEAQAVLTKRARGEARAWLEQPNDDGLPGGCLLLTHTGSGCFDVLVITGEQRGTVWFHDTQRLFPLGTMQRPVHFFDWMEDWLDSCLRRLTLPT